MIKQKIRLAISLIVLLFNFSKINCQTQSFPANKTYKFGLQATNRSSSDAISNYNLWKTNFLEQCSEGRYRVKFDNVSHTVSEGIGYGMLLTAYAGDRTIFDGLLKYYKSNLNGNAVMNWKINGCTNQAIGQNGATDGELDVAMALIVADFQWGNNGTIKYGDEAKSLINIVKNKEIEAGTFVLKPGDAFGGTNLTNPSYFATGYFRKFASFMNDPFWNNIADKCYEIINNNLRVNGAAGGIVSDWCKADGNHSSEAGGYVNQGRTYLYDAARTPWRIALDYAWYGNSEASTYCKKTSDFVRVTLGGSRNVKDGYNQNGTAIGTYHNATFVGGFACAAINGGNQAHLNDSYSDLNSLNEPNSYFNQSLKTLYLFFLNGEFYLPGETTITPPPVNYTITSSAGTNGTISPSGAISVASGSNRTFTITPNSGFEINDVLVNGNSVGKVNSYTFNNIRSNQTISATFKTSLPGIITIAATAGPNGSISPSGVTTVTFGSNRTYTISPNSGFEINSVLVNGTSVGAVSTYTFSNVRSNQTISATFKAIITGGGGSCLLARFGVPIASPLPSKNSSYSKVHTLGTNAPNLSNVINVAINWAFEPTHFGLYQLSFNTNNGSPSWWIDLKSSVQNFNQAKPSISFNGTGIANLDGNKYYINFVDSGNVVLVEVTGKHAIYFSNSTTSPAGCSTSARLSENQVTEISTSPNPFADYITIKITGGNNSKQISLFDIYGKIVYENNATSSDNEYVIDTSNLSKGIYLLTAKDEDTTITKKIIKQ